MSRFDPAIKWLKTQAAKFEAVALPKSAAAADPAVAPPSVASKGLLGTTAHGMNELVADEVLGAGGYAAPGVAATAPASQAIAERAARSAGNTLDAAEGGFTRFASAHAAHRPATAPAPKPYDKRLHGDGGRVPDEAKGQGR